MRAAVGDHIIIASNTIEQPVREGRVLEVRGADGAPPYLVEWADSGHQGLLIPGPDAHVQHMGPDGQPILEPTMPAPTRKPIEHSWQVNVTIVEDGPCTTAHAVLIGELPSMAGDGVARRNPSDLNVPEIGDELAVARALHRLADRLLAGAAVDIGDIEGVPVALRF